MEKELQKHMSMTDEQLDTATKRALNYLADQGCEAVIICAAAKSKDDVMLWKVQHKGKDAQAVSNLAYASISYIGSHLAIKAPPAKVNLPPSPLEVQEAAIINTTMTPPKSSNKQLKDFRPGVFYGVNVFYEVPREDFVGHFVLLKIPLKNTSRVNRCWVEVLGIVEDEKDKLYGRLGSVDSRSEFQTGDVVEFTTAEICGWMPPKPPEAA